ncbi:MAG: hypothetical protein ACE5JM_12770 [Armatimonadota bacterium]
MGRTHPGATIWILIMGLLLLPTVAGAPVNTPAIAKLLPASGELKGWALVPGTLTHCASSKELHKIYNGGDGEYIKAGVTEAIQGMYKNGSTIATVVLHKFGTDWKKSKARYTARSAALSKAKGYATVPVKNAGCYGQPPGGMVYGYSWTGPYMARYEFTKPDAASAAQSFMKNVSGKCSRLLASKTAR